MPDSSPNARATVKPVPSAEPSKLPRRERERLRQREEILAAALELFSEKGFHRVRMQDIARKAEFAVGTLYRFFKDKEDLYRALVRSRAEHFHSTLKAVLTKNEREDPVSVLKRYLEAKANLLAGGVAMLKLYFAETRGARFSLRAGLDRELLQLYEDLLRQLARVFERGIRRKVFRALDPYKLAVALEGMTNGFLQLWVEQPERYPFDQQLALILDLFLHGVVIDEQRVQAR